MAVHKYTRADGSTCYRAVYLTPDGTRRSEHVRTVASTGRQKDHLAAEVAAANRAHERRAEVENKTWTDPAAPVRSERLTFRRLVERFLASYRTKANRIAYYEERAVPWLAFFGDRPVLSITPADVERFRNARLEDVSASTVKKDLTALNTLLTWAEVNGYIPASPATAKKVQRPREDRRAATYLTDDQEAALLAAARPWLADVIRWLLGSGMDRGEVVRLTWGDVDEAAGVVHAPRGKTGVSRDLPLNATLRGVLRSARAHRAECEARHRKNVSRLRRDPEADLALEKLDRVFLGDHGEVLTDSGLKTAMRKVYIRAKLEVGQPTKVMRHTFASRLAMRGASMVSIARLMGQTTLSVTDRYLHLSPAFLLEEMTLLDPPSEPEATEASPAVGGSPPPAALHIPSHKAKRGSVTGVKSTR